VRVKVLLTGGAGYIGSHTAVELVQLGHEVTILDNFANSSPEVLTRIEMITGVRPALVMVDLTELEASTKALSAIEFDSVIHFAGLKAVGESVRIPTTYYRVNLVSTLNLLEIMSDRDVRQIVFSSSATVYGDPQSELISESHPVGVGVTNPYGWSKAMNEQIIRDAQLARPELGATLLRYFNPVGAHSSGLIGEDPQGIPNNLMPFIAQVAVGRHPKLRVFGDTYDTPDGTGIRDYIHVTDLALGHIAALTNTSPGLRVFNLGSGHGSSVLEVVSAFSAAAGHEIPFEIVEARPGDVARVVADPSAAESELHWKTERTLEQACRDTWNWQSKNPNGFIAA